MPEETRISKEEANFRLNGGVEGHRCGECQKFQNGGCVMVNAKAHVEDVCDAFVPSVGTGNMTAMQAVVQPVYRGENVAEVEMLINRVAVDKQTGARRWFATASGTKVDAYKERMSVGLFKDFIRRIENGETAPEPFTSRAWNGGLPYLGVAHYLDLGGEAIVGPTEQVWVDGDIFKARGTFARSKVGDAAYVAIKRDIEQSIPKDERIRISIAFVDWGHDHDGIGSFQRRSLLDRCEHCSQGVGGKVYRAGQLVHLALTRRPAYEETTIQLEERSAMTTRRDDAASIVGDELADELERKSKSLTERSAPAIDPLAVVVRQDEEENPEAEVEPEEEETKPMKKKKPTEAEQEVEEDEEEDEEEELGGATSMDEAESFLTRSTTVKFVDPWVVLGSVLTNIVGKGKAELVNRAVADFQDRIDILALKTLMEVRDAMSKGVVKVEQPEATPATVTPENSIADHPLDAAFLKFRSVFDDALATKSGERDRLRMIQAGLNDFGAVIREQVTALPSPESAPVERSDGQNTVADEVKSLRGDIDRLTALVAASVSQSKPVERKAPVGPAVPAPRALRGIEVAKSEVAASRKVSPLKAMVRRSVGLS